MHKDTKVSLFLGCDVLDHVAVRQALSSEQSTQILGIFAQGLHVEVLDSCLDNVIGDLIQQFPEMVIKLMLFGESDANVTDLLANLVRPDFVCNVFIHKETFLSELRLVMNELDGDPTQKQTSYTQLVMKLNNNGWFSGQYIASSHLFELVVRASDVREFKGMLCEHFAQYHGQLKPRLGQGISDVRLIYLKMTILRIYDRVKPASSPDTKTD